MSKKEIGRYVTAAPSSDEIVRQFIDLSEDFSFALLADAAGMPYQTLRAAIDRFSEKTLARAWLNVQFNKKRLDAYKELRSTLPGVPINARHERELVRQRRKKLNYARAALRRARVPHPQNPKLRKEPNE